MSSIPPVSQFRRPWSPEPFESSANGGLGFQVNSDSYDEIHRVPPQRQGSDVSVEALDLADYARTLRSRQHDDPYPAFSPNTSRPASLLRPLASLEPLQAPSLVSRAETLSSNTHSLSSHSRHRPFSLPLSSRLHVTYSANDFPRQRMEPHVSRSHESEIDISNFPAWSQNWYDSHNRSTLPTSPPDIYTPLPPSYLNSKTRPSLFDPDYVHNGSDYVFDPYNYAPTSSLGHDSTRNLLPWSNDPLDSPPINKTLKEERVRMLEREFGPKFDGNAGAGSEGDFMDENGKPLIGTVDPKGNLVTQGPRKRTAFRVLQVVLVLAAGVPSIYAALIIKPQGTPPPAGKPPAFALYILSVLTFLVLFYLFVVRPCCCGGRRPKARDTPLSNGMMVLPVQGLPGREKGKKRSNKKEKGTNRVGQTDVQVNLIVDPEVFTGREDDESEEGEETTGGGWGGSMPGAYSGRKKRKTRRRGLMAGLAMEERWKEARAWARKVAFVDVVGMFLWGAAFVFILIGKRCPSGSFDGWCNAYNVSSAAACLLSVAFGVSTFFDVKDLHSSKASPRTRT